MSRRRSGGVIRKSGGGKRKSCRGKPVSCQFLGVTLDRRRMAKPYRATVSFRGVQVRLGSFANPRDAAMARDQEARRLHGNRARLNFPGPGEIAAHRAGDWDLSATEDVAQAAPDPCATLREIGGKVRGLREKLRGGTVDAGRISPVQT